MRWRRRRPHQPATVDERLARIEQVVTAGPGTLAAGLRQAAYAGGELTEPLGSYVDKVRRHAYRVTDGDVDALHGAGYSDDQIFEATVAAAAGAGMDRIRIGLAALEAGG